MRIVSKPDDTELVPYTMDPVAYENRSCEEFFHTPTRNIWLNKWDTWWLLYQPQPKVVYHTREANAEKGVIWFAFRFVEIGQDLDAVDETMRKHFEYNQCVNNPLRWIGSLAVDINYVQNNTDLSTDDALMMAQYSWKESERRNPRGAEYFPTAVMMVLAEEVEDFDGNFYKMYTIQLTDNQGKQAALKISDAWIKRFFEKTLA